MTRSTKLGLIVVVLIGTLSSCGRGSHAQAQAVGRIVEVGLPHASINNEHAFSGKVLRKGETLATDEHGQVTFELRTPDVRGDCAMERDGSVRLYPPDVAAVAQFTKGRTECDGEFYGPEEGRMVLGLTEARSRQATFQLDAQPQEQSVSVFRGFVDAGPPGNSQLVGPDSRAIVGAGLPPKPAEHVDLAMLPAAERERIERLKSIRPLPDFRLPESGGSATLARAKGRRALRVAIDPVGSRQAHGFSRSFLGFLGERWGLRIELSTPAASVVDVRLRAGDVELVASPEPVPGARSLPFFTDEGGKQWSLHGPNQDPEFAASITGFLKPALDVGEYGRRYRESFQRIPDYEVVRPLILAPRDAGAPGGGPRTPGTTVPPARTTTSGTASGSSVTSTTASPGASASTGVPPATSPSTTARPTTTARLAPSTRLDRSLPLPPTTNPGAPFNLVASPTNARCYYVPNGALSGGDELGVGFPLLLTKGKARDLPGLVRVSGRSDSGLSAEFWSAVGGETNAQFDLRAGDFGRTHRITITVDSDDRVAEVDDGDNHILAVVSIPAPRPATAIHDLPCTVSRAGPP